MPKVCIDPGHNAIGADTGAQGNGLREADLNLDIAQRLNALLEKNGLQVVMTRDGEFVNGPHSTVNESLKTRCDIANRFGADLFVSIHVNAGGGTGTEIYALPGGQAIVCAQRVLERIIFATNWANRGVKTNRQFYVLLHTNMPAILTENGFIDSQDAKKLADPEFRQIIAEAHAKGICDFFGLDYGAFDQNTPSKIPQEPPKPTITQPTLPPSKPDTPKTQIMGTETITIEQCNQFILRRNPNAPDIIPLYKKYGEILGIRWGYAVAQMIKETGYLNYGGNVQAGQNNFAGIGAIGSGLKGASFETPEEGVLAQLEHLYAYATTRPLPSGIFKVDPRFDLVERGISPNWEDLDGRWAVPGEGYGQDIIRIYNQITNEIVTTPISPPKQQPTEKPWYDSKTVWVNFVMLAGLMAEQLSGTDVLTSEMEASIIAVVNVILRIITKDKITWK